MSHQVLEPPVGTDSATSELAPLNPGEAGVSVVGRLLDVVRARPDAVAVRDDDTSLTYAELDVRTAPLARAAAAGAGDAPVAVLARQSAGVVLGYVTALRAGHAAVLLDPFLPDERIAQILAATGASVILTDASLGERAGSLAGTALVIDVEAPAPATEGLPEPTPGRGQDPATIVFTSGSTGTPKGVVLSHDTVVNGAAISGRGFRVTPDDEVAAVLPIAFAAGQETLWYALLNGATAHVHDPRDAGLRGFGAWLTERRITTLHATPSMLRSIVGALDGTFTDVRLHTTCGEAVHGSDVLAARAHFPGAEFVSWLGASEIGHLAFHHVGPDDDVAPGVVPVGRVVPSKQVVILDDDGAAVPAGTSGAVEVRSAFLASSYWNDPEGTTAKFRPTADGLVAVRTGDLGRLGEDGTLQVTGRADQAVKVRGYLVEPAEVEAALRDGDDILDAAVVATGEGSARQLVAYAVPDGRRRTPSQAGLRRRLSARLPEWMVPARIVLLTELPRTERGKLDRAALPAPPPLPDPVPPADQWEAELADIWTLVLDAPVGRDSSFATLGGDSLAVEEMLTIVHERLGVELLPFDLASHPTLREFAALVSARSRSTVRTSARKARRGAPMARLRDGEGPAILCFSGAGGSPALFAGFAAEIGGDEPVHAFAVNGFENRGIPDWTVGATARRYLRLMERIGPEATRPKALVGHSLGGLFALEVARRITAAGAPAPLVVILDTILPPSTAVASGDEAPQVRVPGFREQTTSERWATRFCLLGAGLVNYDDATRKDVFFQHGARLTKFHRPEPWNGPAVVFRSLENLDDARWWDAVLPGEHDVVEMPCDHVAVLKPPYLSDVVARVRAELDR